MVSLKKNPLKKEQQVREYTPVHLMDEEEAVRTYCPPKESPVTEDVKIIVKQNDGDLLLTINEDCDNKPVKYVDPGRILSLIFDCLMIFICIGVIGLFIWICCGLLGEGLQLAQQFAQML